MKHVVYAILSAFKEMLNFKAIRFALIIGFVVSAVWIVIGFLFWHHITAFSSYFLELIPFSMLRSNGAWMLSIFLWFELVLITFSIIFAFLGNFISRSISRRRSNLYVLLIILASVIFWGGVWFYQGSYIYQQLLHLLTWLPFETIDKGLAFIIGIYIIYTAIVTTMIFVASSFNYYFIKLIQKKLYPQEKIVKNREIKAIKYTLRDMAIFIVVSIIAIPLLFVPVLNFIIQIALWSWLMKDTFVYDNLSLLSQKEVTKEQLKEHKYAFWSISIFAALFNLIPILNVFGPFFGELAVYHYIKDQRISEKINAK